MGQWKILFIFWNGYVIKFVQYFSLFSSITILKIKKLKTKTIKWAIRYYWFIFQRVNTYKIYVVWNAMKQIEFSSSFNLRRCSTTEMIRLFIMSSDRHLGFMTRKVWNENISVLLICLIILDSNQMLPVHPIITLIWCNRGRGV